MNLLDYEETDTGFVITRQWGPVRGIGPILGIKKDNHEIMISSYDAPFFNLDSKNSSSVYIQGEMGGRDSQPLSKRSQVKYALDLLANTVIHDSGVFQWVDFQLTDQQPCWILYKPKALILVPKHMAARIRNKEVLAHINNDYLCKNEEHLLRLPGEYLGKVIDFLMIPRMEDRFYEEAPIEL